MAKRKAPDGYMYTRKEFIAFYGKAWKTHWRVAAPIHAHEDDDKSDDDHSVEDGGKEDHQPAREDKDVQVATLATGTDEGVLNAVEACPSFPPDIAFPSTTPHMFVSTCCIDLLFKLTCSLTCALTGDDKGSEDEDEDEEEARFGLGLSSGTLGSPTLVSKSEVKSKKPTCPASAREKGLIVYCSSGCRGWKKAPATKCAQPCFLGAEPLSIQAASDNAETALPVMRAPAQPQTGMTSLTRRELTSKLGLARLELNRNVRECAKLVDEITDLEATLRRADPEA